VCVSVQHGSAADGQPFGLGPFMCTYNMMAHTSNSEQQSASLLACGHAPLLGARHHQYWGALRFLSSIRNSYTCSVKRLSTQHRGMLAVVMLGKRTLRFWKRSKGDTQPPKMQALHPCAPSCPHPSTQNQDHPVLYLGTPNAHAYNSQVGRL